jgi:hypothetical protein
VACIISGGLGLYMEKLDCGIIIKNLEKCDQDEGSTSGKKLVVPTILVLVTFLVETSAQFFGLYYFDYTDIHKCIVDDWIQKFDPLNCRSKFVDEIHFSILTGSVDHEKGGSPRYKRGLTKWTKETLIDKHSSSNISRQETSEEVSYTPSQNVDTPLKYHS